MGEYQPWVHLSGVPPVELEDLVIMMEAHNYNVGYLKPQYDWGLYNGSRGSNSLNPNATGLYTYEGKELQGQWRRMRLEEVFYLLGLPPAKHTVGADLSNSYNNIVIDNYYPYISTEALISYFLTSYGGYSYCMSNADIEIPFSTVNNAEVENSVLYYYDYYTANKWVPYDLIADVEVYIPDANEGGDARISGGNIRIVNPGAHHYDVLNSKRYDSEGNPQYAVVTIVDNATLKTESYIAILPDDDNWEDPCKNESSADGKIVKGLTSSSDIKNIYTKERWKFFMEPSGAVLIKDSDLFPPAFEGYSGDLNFFYFSWGGDIMNNGKRLSYAYPFMYSYTTAVQQAVHLVQDANP